MSRKEITHFLRIHEKTVSTYRARILIKLNANTLVDLIRYAAEEGSWIKHEHDCRGHLAALLFSAAPR